jgi:hypothetical protein
LQVAGCGLQVAGCGLQVAGCGLQVAGCRLRVAGCRLRVAGCGLQVAGCGLQVAGCRLRVAGCRLQVIISCNSTTEKLNFRFKTNTVSLIACKLILLHSESYYNLTLSGSKILSITILYSPLSITEAETEAETANFFHLRASCFKLPSSLCQRISITDHFFPSSPTLIGVNLLHGKK